MTEQKKRIWLYPGSFDPFTSGHLAIVKQAAKQVDELQIVILSNPKKQAFLPVELRRQLISASLMPYPELSKVKVLSHQGLLIDIYESSGASAVVRGVRNFQDFEYERNYCLANQAFLPGCAFVYLVAPVTLNHVSSSLVRELLSYARSAATLMEPEAYKLLQEYLEKLKIGKHS